MTTRTYPPDHSQRLFNRSFSLLARDVETLYVLRDAKGHRTAAETLSWLLREFGEQELEQLQP